MSDATTFRLEIAGADQVAAGFEKVKGAIAASEAETAKAAQSTRALGDAHDQSNPKLSQFGSTLGMVGSALGQTNPQLGSMVSTLGQSVGAVTALEAALGPLGIALGIATTAFALYERATAKASDTMDAGANSLSTYIGKLQQATEAARTFANTQVGLGNAIQQGARVLAAQERYRAAAAAVNNAGLIGNHANEFTARQELAAANQELHEAVQAQTEAARHEREYAEGERALAATRAETTAAPSATPRSVGGRRGGVRGIAGLTGAQIDAFNDNAAGALADKAAGFAAGQASEAQVAMAQEQALADKRAQWARQQAEQDQRNADARAALLDKQVAAEEAAAAQAIENTKKQAAEWQAYFGQIAGATSQLTELIAAGAKTEEEGQKIRAYGKGMNEMIQGAIDAAQVVSDIASYNYGSAVLHGVSSGLHFAAGAQAFAYAGKGGGGAHGGGSAGAGAAATTRPLNSGSGGGSGGVSYTYNILGPMVTESGKAALGRTLDDLARSGRRRFGTLTDGTAA